MKRKMKELDSRALQKIRGGAASLILAKKVLSGLSLVGGAGGGIYTLYKFGRGILEGRREKLDECDH